MDQELRNYACGRACRIGRYRLRAIPTHQLLNLSHQVTTKPNETVESLHLLMNELIQVSRWSPPVRKWVVTAIGLSAIPFIIHPIDAAVEVGMNRTIRQLYNQEDQS
ncbi:hypothetical protein COOONC_13108 [Cooperia oncophora]